MTDTQALRQRLSEIRRTLQGEPRLAALEAHLEAVESHDDRPLVNETLAALIDCYEYSADSTRLLTPFARLLRNYDTEPEHFDPRVLRSVFWQFKWVVYDLIDHPEIPLAAIEDWLGQFRTRYTEAGHSLHPVHEAEHFLSVHIGDIERAEAAAATLARTDPDGMSDCEACRCNYQGHIAFDTGDHETALQHWEPLRKGGKRCMHEPHHALSLSQFSLTALGRLDEARADHLHGYRISVGKDDMVHYVARHLRFCALTGNEARAMEILSANLRAFDLHLKPSSRAELLEGVQALCKALRGRGLGGTALQGPERRSWTADELHDWADAERRALCERYDRRNGTDAYSRQSALSVEPATPYPHVPLGFKTLPTAPKAVVPEVETAESFAELLTRARALTAAFDDEADLLWRAVDRRAAKEGIELEAADEAEVLLSRLDPNRDLDEALDFSARARERFIAAGLPGRALINHAATLAWRLEREPDAVIAEAEIVLAEAERLAETAADDALRARALAYCALLEHRGLQGLEPDAGLLERVAALDTELAAFPDDRRAADSRVLLAFARANSETDLVRRTEALRVAFEAAVAGEHYREIFIGAVQYAAALTTEGRHEEALEVAETGLACVEPGAAPLPLAALHLGAAENTIYSGLWWGAERHALRAAALFDGEGYTALAGVARHLLGKALAAQNRHDEAVLILDAALADLPLTDEDQHWRLVDARVALARSYQALWDGRNGVEHALKALQLMENGTTHPDPTCYPQTAHLAGQLLHSMNDPDAVRRAFADAERAWRELGDLPAAARSAREAAWAMQKDDESPAAVAMMSALADELRSSWEDPALTTEYRERCRAELAGTLLVQANMRSALHEVEEEGEFEPDFELLRYAAAALEVAEAGEYLHGPAVPAARHQIYHYGSMGEFDAAEAVLRRVLDRLDPIEFAGQRRTLQGQFHYLRNIPES